MSDTKTKPARIATSSEIRAREKAVTEFLGWAESLTKGRGNITFLHEKRAMVGEAAAEILRLWAALDVALVGLEAGRDAMAEIKRIKEAA